MTEPKWHNNGWGFPCACTTGHHTEYITVDGLNALEERISDLEARAALADEQKEYLRTERWSYNAYEKQWLARYDALPSTTKEE